MRRVLAEMGPECRPSLESELRSAAVADPEAEALDSGAEEDVGEGDLAEIVPTAGEDTWRYVRNKVSLVPHRVTCGPPWMPPSDWSTACAWRFGLSASAVRAREVATPCTKCFPAGRPPSMG